jgi:SAM-dependent methyltransferase
MFKNLFGSKKEELPMEVIEQPEIETSVDMNTEEFETPMYIENDVELETASLVDLEILEEEELSAVDFGTEELLNNPEVVGWFSIQEQELLFSALLLFYDPSKSVLDVGAGRADLYGYLKRVLNTDQINYKGIDYNPNVLEIAKQKYPGVAVEAVDLLSIDNGADYDWVFASGLFNSKTQEDMGSYVTQCIDKMYEKSKVGIAFNMVTSLADDMADEDKAQFAVYDPAVWFPYLINKYSKVFARTDYMSGDITFIILK